MTEASTTVAWVALGANIGRRGRTLELLRDLLDKPPSRLAAASSELVTRPVGPTAQPDFLNQVARLEAEVPLTPAAWLELCKSVEAAAGRRATYPQGPRRADVDVLLLGPRGEVVVATPELQVPHPRLGERPFFCALLAELEPGLRHPEGWLFAERAGIFR
jgi:2-amino-4-hydroxy-6-hydroxymethyldihydropteridine diphosphokinase